MKNKNILELHDMLVNNEITCLQLLNYYNDNLKQLINDNTNAVLNDLSDQAIKEAKALTHIDKDNLLFGIVCNLKDNINYKGFKTTGGSLFFKDYISIYNATVVETLLDNKVIINSKANMDELGLGGTGLYSGFGFVNNNLYKGYITGGSSSGSALMVANHACQFAIGTDTGDSIRRPASLLGIVGYKPTYGAISRYGVFPYSVSLDHVGILARNVTDIAIICQYIFKKDPKDLTSRSISLNYKKCLMPLEKPINLGYFVNLKKIWKDCDEKNAYFKLIKKLETDSLFILKPIELHPTIINILEALYQVISYSEASSSWNNLTGVIFGPKTNQFNNYDEMINSLRTKYFSKEFKKRLLFGTIATSANNFEDIYLKAKQILDIIKNLFTEYFKNIDCFILPGASSVAFKVDDVINKKAKSNKVDDLLQIANFAHLPSITIPYIKINNLPFGINLFTNKEEDELLLKIAYYFEQRIIND